MPDPDAVVLAAFHIKVLQMAVQTHYNGKRGPIWESVRRDLSVRSRRGTVFAELHARAAQVFLSRVCTRRDDGSRDSDHSFGLPRVRYPALEAADRIYKRIAIKHE